MNSFVFGLLYMFLLYSIVFSILVSLAGEKLTWHHGLVCCLVRPTLSQTLFLSLGCLSSFLVLGPLGRALSALSWQLEKSSDTGVIMRGCWGCCDHTVSCGCEGYYKTMQATRHIWLNTENSWTFRDFLKAKIDLNYVYRYSGWFKDKRPLKPDF